MTHVSRAVLTVSAELKECATQTSFTRLTANKCEAVAVPQVEFDCNENDGKMAAVA